MLMGQQIPCKLATSGQEFDATLVDSQTLKNEEMKRDKGV